MTTRAALPALGHGYIARERLGRGAWKEAFRAVTTGNKGWRDVAVLRYLKRPDTEELLNEIRSGYSIMIKPPTPKHLTRLLDFFVTVDGDPVLVQELLYRALDRLAPLSAAERYLRIARDLFKGLAELHLRDVMHRDLKLDNCGVDYNDSAKLFDLSLATNLADAPSRGTVYTLAPDLCLSNKQYTKAADVWALGATLYALRFGYYPHATRAEIEKRRALDPDVAADQAKREEMAAEIKRRRTEEDAEKRLFEEIRSFFPPSPAELLCRIMSYSPGERPTADEAAAGWAECLQQWLTPARERSEGVGTPNGSAAYRVLSAQLNAVVCQGARISPKQWDRACSMRDEVLGNLSAEDRAALEKLFAQVAELRTTGMLP